MTSLTRAAIAARYGRSSTRRRVAAGTGSVTGRRSVSWLRAAAPRPGKCLAAAATPPPLLGPDEVRAEPGHLPGVPAV